MTSTARAINWALEACLAVHADDAQANIAVATRVNDKNRLVEQ
jgi:hypothetical protein